MKLNLFNIPIYIGNIDVNKIIIENSKFEKTWKSKTESSYYFDNKIKKDSVIYLLDTISNLIRKDMSSSINLKLLNIWENRYLKKDFQERHLHPHSHFSFVIYKKIKTSNTVFINPSDKLIESYYLPFILNNSNLFDIDYQPELREGQIIVFPSFLEHMVLPNDDNVTISGNIIFEQITNGE